jgi:hypothetical protein
LPVARITRSLGLSGSQDTALRDLNGAWAQAADILKESCQPGQSLTPTGRLAAMEDRLNSMQEALSTLEPALAKFYDHSATNRRRTSIDLMCVRVDGRKISLSLLRRMSLNLSATV